MSNSKMRVALLALLGSALIASAANAAWTTPTAVTASSMVLNYQYAEWSADGYAGSYAKFGCDDGTNLDTSNDISTGFVIYDLGSTQLVSGMQLTVRNATNSGMPKNLDFFSISDANVDTLVANGYIPNGTQTLADLLATGYPVIGANATLPYVNLGAMDEVDLASANQFVTRYVGLKFNTTYDLPAGKCNTIAEVAFDISAPPVAVPVTWTGASSTTWSAGTTGNWKKTSDGTAAEYANGVDVTFGDSPTRSTADISVADVTPSSVLFNNATTDLSVSGSKGITGSATVTKQGAAKVTITSPNTYTGATTVKAGTLELGAGAQAPVMTGTGGADIRGGKLVLDYTTTAPDVKTPLVASYAAGWATGQIRNTTAGTTGLTLGWKDDTGAKQVTVMATLTGDADLNGSVTGADLSLLLSKYNQTGTWSVGDFNYDGSVTGADLSLLLSKYNQSIPASVAGAAVAGVPEPSSLVMLATLAAAMGLGVAGRRRFAARRLLRTFRASILKEVPMKRVLIRSACIVMSSALIARAGVMPFGTFTKGGESVAVDYTRTAQSGALAGLDLVILSVDSINGAGSSLINGVVNAGVGNPTFTGLNGSYMYICDPGAVYITNSLPASLIAPGSYINFDSVGGAFAGTLKSGAPAYAATLGAVHGYVEWSAGVFTTGAGIGVGGTLAAIYVPTNGDFQLAGGLSLQDGNVLTGSGMTTSNIPEPTTLALLATGLLGLLAYAWRSKRT